MKAFLLVGMGGFVGAASRYGLGGWVQERFGTPDFPIATTLINLLGCLMIGLLAGFIERFHFFTLEWRLLLFTGLLGGFTTFSAFSFETVYLIKRGHFGFAAINAILIPILGVGLAWLGIRLGEVFHGYVRLLP